MKTQADKLLITKGLDRALQGTLEEVWSQFLFGWDRLSTGTSDPIIRTQDVRRLDVAITELGRAITGAQKAGVEAIELLHEAMSDDQYFNEPVTLSPSPFESYTPPVVPNRYKLVDHQGRSVPITAIQDPTVEHVLIGKDQYRAVFRGNPIAERFDGKDSTGGDRWLPMNDPILELRVILNALAQRQDRNPGLLQPYNPTLPVGGLKVRELNKVREILSGQAAQMSTTFGVPSAPIRPSNGINVHNIHKPGE